MYISISSDLLHESFESIIPKLQCMPPAFITLYNKSYINLNICIINTLAENTMATIKKKPWRIHSIQPILTTLFISMIINTNSSCENMLSTLYSVMAFRFKNIDTLWRFIKYIASYLIDKHESNLLRKIHSNISAQFVFWHDNLSFSMFIL